MAQMCLPRIVPPLTSQGPEYETPLSGPLNKSFLSTLNQKMCKAADAAGIKDLHISEVKVASLSRYFLSEPAKAAPKATPNPSGA